MEEVERRWKVHSLFDPLARLFGSGKSQDKAANLPDNSALMMSILERMLPQSED